MSNDIGDRGMNPALRAGPGIVIGVATGVIFGIATGNVAIGIAIGLVFGGAGGVSIGKGAVILRRHADRTRPSRQHSFDLPPL